MVGLPWGQFQGCSISPMWQKIFFIWAWVSAVPTMMDVRHARLANIFLSLEGLHITPGESLSIKINSSVFSTPNAQFLLMGRETSLTLFYAPALWSISKSNPFFWNHVVHKNSFVGSDQFKFLGNNKTLGLNCCSCVPLLILKVKFQSSEAAGQLWKNHCPVLRW